MLVVTLAVLNLAFFAWARWIDTPRSRGSSATGSGPVAALELAPAGAAPKPVTVVLRCRTIGPFSDAGAATAAAGVLRAHGWQPRERTADASTPDGYWVYIADLKDSAARRSAVARLNEAGIHDAAAMGTPDQADRVSVGFFSDQMHAVRRAEQVQKLGLKPILDVHQRTVSAPWLDVDLKPSDADPQLSWLQDPAASAASSSANESPSLSIGDCPNKAASG